MRLNFDIKKTFLKNGLEVITIKKDTQIASINVGVKVGAMYENLNEKGISHFIEHLLFKGTEKRDNEKLNDNLESLGGEYNAYTDYSETVYTIGCLCEELKYAVELLGDMVTSSVFPEDEIQKERGVILAEIRTSKDDIEDLSFRKINEIAYNNSPLRYDVTGIEEIVKNIKRDQIVKFYKKYYTPQNSLVTIVSPMEHDEALEMISSNFGKWQGDDLKKPEIIVESNNKITVSTYKKNIEQSTIVYLYTFNELKKEEELPLRILNHRLGESANSLLFRELREKRGLAYDVYTNLDITNDSKSLYIYTSVSNEDINDAINAINQTIEFVKNGQIKLGEKDLDLMKKVHKMAVISTIEDSSELCNYVLHQEIENEDIYEFVSDMKRLNNIDTASVLNVAKLILNNPTIHILTSKKEKQNE